MSNLNPREEEIIDRMIKDRTFRIAMAKKSHYWFFHYYFGPRYAKYRTADFQRQIFNITENPDLQNIIITAFRGSAKSTIITLSYVIWSIVGVKQKKFPVILGHTQLNTQIHLHTIKKELEENTDFRKDFGPFREEIASDGTQSILLPDYGANISTRSIGQNIRGIKYHQHRPDLFIADDIEDSDSVRTQENRDKLFDWLTSDVIPAGDKDTQLVFIGTPLHNDSILMRLKQLFKDSDPKKHIFCEFPIIDQDGKPLWPGKFTNEEDIKSERTKCFNDFAWRREYLLEIVDSEDQIIKRDHIKYYQDLPTENSRFAALSIDPARSQKATADCTAMVSGKMYGYGKDATLYIMPNPVNERLSTDQLIERAMSLSKALGGNYYSRVYVEDVNFQGIITDILKARGVPAIPFPLRGMSKEDRLIAISSLIQIGSVRFAQTGNEELIEQLLGFGREAHDDLVDGLTMLIIQAFTEAKKPRPSIVWI